MKIEEVLEKTGMSTNEIKVYLTLNDNGSNKAGQIAKIAKIDRSSCYGSLKKLIEKGLVSYVSIGKIKWFQSAEPKKIIDYLKEQQEDVKSILPQLDKRQKQKRTKGQVRLYKGEKGVKTVFYDILREGKNNDVFGSEGQLSDRMPMFVKQYIRMQNEKKMKTRNLIGINGRRRYSDGTSYRFVNKEIQSNVVTNIYGNKIGIIIWTDEPEAIIIENESAAKAYKSYFEFMWENAQKK